jgi:hypothetical protein
LFWLQFVDFQTPKRTTKAMKLWAFNKEKKMLISILVILYGSKKHRFSFELEAANIMECAHDNEESISLSYTTDATATTILKNTHE